MGNNSSDNKELLSENLELIRKSIDRSIFNASEPAVMVVKGGWGKGKTFFWKNNILARYDTSKHGYVSVFNADSLKSIRDSVVIEATQDRVIQDNKSVDEFKEKNSLFRKYGKEVAAKFGSFVSNKIGIPDSLLSSMFEDVVLKPGWVLCIDDVERLPSNISMEAFMGYVSSLKEDYGINVVLIFNEDELNKKNKKVLVRYYEKVVDRELLFSPDINQIVRLVLDSTFPDDEVLNKIVDKCKVLGLENIRILSRAKNYFEEFNNALPSEANDDFKIAMMTSILLFCQVKFASREVRGLNFEFLAKWSGYSQRLESALDDVFDEDEDNSPTKENLLFDLEYSHSDEFDLLLMEFINTSILDEKKLAELFNEYETTDSRAEHADNFDQVWQDYYHKTLSDNESVFVEKLIEATNQYMHVMPIDKFDVVLVTLRRLNRDTEADALMKEYVSKRQETINRYDRTSYLSYPEDPQLLAIIKEAERIASIDNRQIEEVIESASKENDFIDAKDRERLAQFSAEEFVSYFTSNDMPHLTSTIRHLAKLTRSTDAVDTEINQKLKQAAEIIANQNTMNRMRMESMGMIAKEVQKS